MSHPNSKLNLKAVKAYTYCPLYFRLKYDPIAGRLHEEKNLQEEVLRRTGRFILYAAQGGRYPSKHSVSMAYNRLTKAVYKTMKSVRHDAVALKTGLKNALHMLDFLRSNGKPVLVSYTGDMRCGQESIEVVIDGVLEHHGQLKAVTLVPWEQKEYEILPVDPEVSVVWLTAERILAKPLGAVVVYHLFHGIGEEVSTQGLRAEGVEQMLESVVRGIRQEIFFPSAGRPCRRCVFYPFCNTGKIDF
jgi:hypothetical protein